jgi:hypothetical protein
LVYSAYNESASPYGMGPLVKKLMILSIFWVKAGKKYGRFCPQTYRQRNLYHLISHSVPLRKPSYRYWLLIDEGFNERGRLPWFVNAKICGLPKGLKRQRCFIGKAFKRSDSIIKSNELKFLECKIAYRLNDYVNFMLSESLTFRQYTMNLCNIYFFKQWYHLKDTRITKIKILERANIRIADSADLCCHRSCSF